MNNKPELRPIIPPNSTERNKMPNPNPISKHSKNRNPRIASFIPSPPHFTYTINLFFLYKIGSLLEFL
jgi:hypothetical protein